MIGLAVGIDYALFILSRHRTQLAAGMDPEESAGPRDRHGRLGRRLRRAHRRHRPLGPVVVGIPFLTVMGLGAAGTVLVAVLVALTLLPALLGFAGARLAPRPGSRAARARAGRRRTDDGRRRLDGRALDAPGHPAAAAHRASSSLAAVLVSPSRRRSCSSRCPTTPPPRRTAPQRQAYDLISDHFGPGLNGPLVVLVAGPRPGHGPADRRHDRRRDRRHADRTPGQFTGGLDDVAYAAPSVLPGGTTALVTVIPESGPQEEATNALVGDLRDRPSRTSSSGPAPTSPSPARPRSPSTSPTGSARRCCRSPWSSSAWR